MFWSPSSSMCPYTLWDLAQWKAFFTDSVASKDTGCCLNIEHLQRKAPWATACQIICQKYVENMPDRMSETHALRLVGITRRNPNQHLYHIIYIYINMNKQLHISVLMYSYFLNHKLTGFLCVDRCSGYAYIHAQHVQPHLCLKPCCAHLGICFFLGGDGCGSWKHLPGWHSHLAVSPMSECASHSNLCQGLPSNGRKYLQIAKIMFEIR